MRQLDSITDSMDMNLSKPEEIVKDREAWFTTNRGHNLATEQQLKDCCVCQTTWQMENVVEGPKGPA